MTRPTPIDQPDPNVADPSVADLAHDLRNVLTPIQIHAEWLTGREDAEYVRRGERIQRAADRAIALIDGCLSDAATDAPDPHERHAAPPMATPPMGDDAAPRTDCGEILHWLRDAVPSGAETLVHLEPPTSTVRLTASNEIYRVALNLLSNAISASCKLRATGTHGGAGPIRLSLRPHGTDIHIDVRDSGPGLDAGALDWMRSARTSRIGPDAGAGTPAGTHGFGLRAVDRITRAFGGRFEMVSTGPSGTHMRAVLPGLVELDVSFQDRGEPIAAAV